jgi:hypothetical protein
VQAVEELQGVAQGIRHREQARAGPSGRVAFTPHKVLKERRFLTAGEGLRVGLLLADLEAGEVAIRHRRNQQASIEEEVAAWN